MTTVWERGVETAVNEKMEDPEFCRVICGVLKKMRNGEFDERGRPSKVIDMEYYPEVARDCVPTIQEYERKLRQLPRKARLKAILGGREVERRQISSVAEVLHHAAKKSQDLAKKS